MPRHQHAIALVVVVGCPSWIGAARGAVVEAIFTGEVTAIEPALTAAGAPYDQIQLNDPFVLTYLFDSGTPNLGPGTTIGDAIGRYAIISAATTIGPFASAGTPANINDGGIVVRDGASLDSYHLGAELPAMILSFELTVAAILDDSSATALPDTSLPLSLDVADFDTAVLQLRESGRFVPPAMPRLFVEARILGFQSRIVPEPTAIALALVGGVFAWRGRNRNGAMWACP